MCRSGGEGALQASISPMVYRGFIAATSWRRMEMTLPAMRGDEGETLVRREVTV